MMLTVLHPDTWGSIGANDPSYWVMWRYTGASTWNAKTDLVNMGDNIGGYRSRDTLARVMGQIGTRISPNPDKAIYYDHPVDLDGNWIPEVKEKWEDYDLSNPDIIAEHSETLKNLLSFTVITPTGGGLGGENKAYINNTLRSAGITVTTLDSPGGHADYMPERFIAIAEEILRAIEGADVSVSPQGSTTVTWGAIKQKH